MCTCLPPHPRAAAAARASRSAGAQIRPRGWRRRASPMPTTTNTVSLPPCRARTRPLQCGHGSSRASITAFSPRMARHSSLTTMGFLGTRAICRGSRAPTCAPQLATGSPKRGSARLHASACSLVGWTARRAPCWPARRSTARICTSRLCRTTGGRHASRPQTGRRATLYAAPAAMGGHAPLRRAGRAARRARGRCARVHLRSSKPCRARAPPTAALRSRLLACLGLRSCPRLKAAWNFRCAAAAMPGARAAALPAAATACLAPHAPFKPFVHCLQRLTMRPTTLAPRARTHGRASCSGSLFAAGVGPFQAPRDA